MNTHATLQRLQMLERIEQMLISAHSSSDDAEEDYYMLMSLQQLFDELLNDRNVPRALAHLDGLKELTAPTGYPRDLRYDFRQTAKLKEIYRC